MTFNPNKIELIATVCFFIALIHTFSVTFFNKLASKYKEGSVLENLFHILGEVEIVFGFWSAIFILLFILLQDKASALLYLNSRNYTEALFVFTIMVVSSSKPVLDFSNQLISFIAKLIPLSDSASYFLVCFGMAPLLGSFITEPAAMTVVANLVLVRFFSRSNNLNFKYAMIGLLFVNISIGGTLTAFAAPPVLMVAQKWNWDFLFMLTHFGWKAILSCLVSTGLILFYFKKEIALLGIDPSKEQLNSDEIIVNVKASANIDNKLMSLNSHQHITHSPLWIKLVSLFFVMLIVANHNQIVIFIGLFLFFLGFSVVTKEYQSELKIKESLLVGFFLAGLVVLGGMQSWWISPLISELTSIQLYTGAMALTAITDNAAITYLGSLVQSISETSKYYLVAGAVVGGGLTVIANAPNPAGYGILVGTFPEGGIKPIKLLLFALIPTVVAAVCFSFN